MEVVFLGTGGPIPDAEFGGQGIAVLPSDEEIIIMDCGPSVPLRLSQAGLDRLRISHICITHLHFDHVSDLITLIFHCGFQGKQDGLRIIGPPGIREFVTNLLQTFRVDFEERSQYRPSYARVHDHIHVTEMKHGDTYQGANWTLTAAEVSHLVENTCLALRLDVPATGKSFVYSGDTRLPNANMQWLAQDADLLVHEIAGLPLDIKSVTASMPDVQTFRALCGHAEPHEVGELATQSNVARLALTHYNHLLPVFSREELVAKARQTYAGATLLVKDLDRVQI